MKAISTKQQAVKVYVLIKGSLVAGEKTRDTYSDPIDDRMRPQQITAQQEKRLPEGSYKAGDMKFYAAGSAAKYKSGDQIEFSGIKYRIGDISERHEGGFVIYLAKRPYERD